MSEKLEKQASADVMKANEILSKEALKLYEEQRAKEEAREVKLRYLNSFTGDSYPNYSYRQKLERFGHDPHFDIFFNSSRQFRYLEVDHHGKKNGEKKLESSTLLSAQTKDDILYGN